MTTRRKNMKKTSYEDLIIAQRKLRAETAVAMTLIAAFGVLGLVGMHLRWF
jgi:hypothetical protein